MDDKLTDTADLKNNVASSEVEILKLQIKMMQQQIADLEKNNGRVVDVLKWGMGMFITFAVVFAGFNWWSGKTNYDRDREALKQQGAMLDQSLALSQKDAAATVQKEFADFRVSNEKQLATIRLDVETNMAIMIRDRGKQLEDAALKIQTFATNLDETLASRFKEYHTHIAEAARNVDATNVLAVSNLLVSVNAGLAGARGLSLLVQADFICRNNRSTSAESAATMAEGLSAYAAAGLEFIKANDDEDLENCLKSIVKYFPILINKSPRNSFFPLDDMFDIGNGMENLVAEVRKYSASRKFDGRASEIQSFNTIYKRLVADARQMEPSGVKVLGK